MAWEAFAGTPDAVALGRMGFGTGIHAATRPAARFYGQQDAHRVHGRMHMEFRVH